MPYLRCCLQPFNELLQVCLAALDGFKRLQQLSLAVVELEERCQRLRREHELTHACRFLLRAVGSVASPAAARLQLLQHPLHIVGSVASLATARLRSLQRCSELALLARVAVLFTSEGLVVSARSRACCSRSASATKLTSGFARGIAVLIVVARLLGMRWLRLAASAFSIALFALAFANGARQLLRVLPKLLRQLADGEGRQRFEEPVCVEAAAALRQYPQL